MIIEGPNGETITQGPVTSNHCQHDVSFFANPDYQEVLNQQEYELNIRRQEAGGYPEEEDDDDDDDDE